MSPLKGLSPLLCVRYKIFVPKLRREPGTFIVYSLYIPCIPCLAIALSFPITPLENRGVFVLELSLMRTYKLHFNDFLYR